MSVQFEGGKVPIIALAASAVPVRCKEFIILYNFVPTLSGLRERDRSYH